MPNILFLAAALLTASPIASVVTAPEHAGSEFALGPDAPTWIAPAAEPFVVRASASSLVSSSATEGLALVAGLLLLAVLLSITGLHLLSPVRAPLAVPRPRPAQRCSSPALPLPAGPPTELDRAA